MTTDLVSIITRTKDRESLLAEAIASVQAQTHPHVEHIVVNDGGADVSALITRLAGRHPIRYVSAGSVGRCKAGNLGLAQARGRYIGWLDDDDLYYPDHVASLVGGLKASGLKIAYGDADLVHQTYDPATKTYKERSRAPAPTFEYSKIALWRRGDMHLVTVLHDRECSDRLGGFDETLPVLEDMEMFGRFAQDYDFFHVRKVTSAFRVRDDNTNAVTALRQEFAATREVLYKRYAHIVMPELLTMVEFGGVELARLKARVDELEAEVRRLRSEPGR